MFGLNMYLFARFFCACNIINVQNIKSNLVNIDGTHELGGAKQARVGYWPATIPSLTHKREKKASELQAQSNKGESYKKVQASKS